MKGLPRFGRRTVQPPGSRRVLAAASHAFLAALTLHAAPVGARDLRPMDPVPRFVLKQTDGQLLDLGTLRGRVLVLNFWATWCKPCREEMPMLESFARDYAQRGVTVIGISIDDPAQRADVLRLTKAITYPIALQADAPVDKIGTPSALPMTYVIDAQGYVSAQIPPKRSALTRQKLEALVLPVLDAAKKPAEGS
jgi:thiol-disulfide isomerase/thioredoxin